MCNTPETCGNSEQIQACYEEIVQSKKCSFAQEVLAYIKKLEFGITCCDDLEHLKNNHRVLVILSNYNPLDIESNTTIYNTMPYSTIKYLLNL